MAQSDLHRDQSTDLPTGYERSDLKPGTIALFGVGLAVVIGAAVVITSLFVHYKRSNIPGKKPPFHDWPGSVKRRRDRACKSMRTKELRQMRAAEDAALNSYGWVDKEFGHRKIPVGSRDGDSGARKACLHESRKQRHDNVVS